MKKRHFTVALVVLLACSLTAAFSAGTKEEKASDGLSGTITFTIWDNNLNDFIESNDMVGKFRKAYPNATVEVEKIKDDSEYWNSMKMRASANQLPDVMFNKPFTLSRFKDFLIDLSDTQAAKNNMLASAMPSTARFLAFR
jgi:raffinose/stachyose/melibiose transport system substrate-binding protein